MRTLTVILCCTIVFGIRNAAAQSGLRIEAEVAFTEGPAWHDSGNVYFTDIANNRIMRRDRTGTLHVFRTPAGRANGLAFDLQGRLLACEGSREGGNRRITRTDLDTGVVSVVTDQFQGKAYNSPNDLVVASDGTIYFTDPRYGDRSDLELFDEQGRAIEGVYRIDRSGQVTRVITHEVDRPNGLAISPDGKYLYVADNVNDGPQQGVGGNRKLWRFARRSDGTVDPATQQLLFDWGTDRGPDGMAIDVQGNLYVTAGFNFPNPPAETAKQFRAGVYVIAATGELKRFIPVPADMVTNCCFGGANLQTLFITAGHKLWSLDVNVQGYRPVANTRQ